MRHEDLKFLKREDLIPLFPEFGETESQLMKHCRYYGRNITKEQVEGLCWYNNFGKEVSSEGMIRMFENWEKNWIRSTLGALEEKWYLLCFLEEYAITANLGHFEEYDGVPQTLKCHFFARFRRPNDYPPVQREAESFKSFYTKFYKAISC